MAQTVDVLRYFLELDSKGFTKESKKADKQAGKLGNTIDKKLTKAVSGLTAGFLAYKGLDITKELIRQGAVAERVAISFNNLSESVGLNGEQILQELREVSRGAIDDVSLMVSASRANVMGLVLEDLPKMLEIARAAGRAFGQSTKFMFDSIVLGTARNSRLILDNLGIIISEVKIYREEAKRLGRALTDAEKRAAFFHAVLEAGGSIISKVGEDAGDTQDEIDRLAASWKNMTDEMGIFLSQAVATDGVVSSLDLIKGRFEDVNAIVSNDTIPLLVKLQSIFGLLSLGALEQARDNKFLADSINDVTKAEKELQSFADKIIDAQIARETGRVTPLTKAERDKIAADEKARIEAAIEIAEIRQKIGETTLLQLIDFIETQRNGILENTKLEEALVKKLHKLRLQQLEFEMKRAMELTIRQSTGAAQRGLPGADLPVGTSVAGGGAGSISFLRSIANEIDLFANEVGAAEFILSSALQDIADNLSEAASRILEITIQLASGDVAGGIANAVNLLINSIFDVFSSNEDRVKGLSQQYKRLNEEMKRNIENADRLTLAERDRQIAFLEERIQRALLAEARAREDENYTLLSESSATLIRQLEALQGAFGDLDEMRGVQNLQDLIAFISGNAQDLDFDTAQQLVRHFANIFDLENEELLDIWTSIQDILLANGNINQNQIFQLEEILHQLEQDVEDQQQALDPLSQTIRSVTTITENQANLMLSVLNSIHAELQNIFNLMARSIGNVSQGGLTAQININANTRQGGREAAKGLISELRAQGVKVA